MIPLFKVFISKNIDLNTIFNSGYIGQGSQVELFEKKLKEFLGYNYLLTLNSCTSALQLAIYLTQSEEVLTTPLTCFATTTSILANKAIPKWVDVDLQTANIDLEDLDNKITYKTKVILLVHFAGYPIDYIRLNQILDHCEYRFGFRPLVIEDCAHAWGSTFNGKLVGTFGNFSCFSFQAVKTLTTGDGGLLLVPEEYYDRAKKLRWFGLDRSLPRNQDIKESGFKYHMNDIAATIGLANLDLIQKEKVVEKQVSNLEYYHTEIPQLTIQKPDNRKANGWLCCLRVDNRLIFEQVMKMRGIEVTQPHFRNDLHSCVKDYRCDLPNMDILDKELTCIPCGWWVNSSFILNQIKKGW